MGREKTKMSKTSWTRVSYWSPPRKSASRVRANKHNNAVNEFTCLAHQGGGKPLIVQNNPGLERGKGTHQVSHLKGDGKQDEDDNVLDNDDCHDQ